MKKYQSIYWEKQRENEVKDFINTYLGNYMQAPESIGVFLDNDEELHKQHTFEMHEFLQRHGIMDWKNNALTIRTKDGGAVAIGEIVMYMDKKTNKSRSWTLKFIFRDIEDKKIIQSTLSLDGLYEFLDELMSWNTDDEMYRCHKEDYIVVGK